MSSLTLVASWAMFVPKPPKVTPAKSLGPGSEADENKRDDHHEAFFRQESLRQASDSQWKRRIP